MSAAAAAAAVAPGVIAGGVSGPDGGAAGGRKVGEKDKRVQPGGTTAELSTVAGWAEAKWVWGLHSGATTDEKRTAWKYVKYEWTIFCRGCGQSLQASSQTWARHVANDSCIATRADPKSHFTGVLRFMGIWPCYARRNDPDPSP
jgi:hypothetical protein